MTNKFKPGDVVKFPFLSFINPTAAFCVHEGDDARGYRIFECHLDSNSSLLHGNFFSVHLLTKVDN